MTYINVNVNDAQEQRPAPKGRYELQITGAAPGVTGPNSKNPGSPTIRVSLGFTDLELNAPNVTHYITLPAEGDEPGASKFKTLLLARFLSAFGISVGNEGFDVDDLAMEMIGHSANIEVGMTEPNDNGDYFNQIMLPKLPEENKGGRGTPPRSRRG
jgi:hypothetical protein